jgi:hypothetical protein
MTQIGAFYPGASTTGDAGTIEIIMAIVVFVWVIWWLVWQSFHENKELNDAVRLYREVGMERAMEVATGKVVTEEELKAREVQRAMGHRASH